MRLDTKEGAFARLDDGELAISPGKPDESELILRIESAEADLHMPPKKSGKSLTSDQIATLRRWVEQGASWSRHWAFDAPKKPAPPVVKNSTWPVNEIDRFILARLEAEGLAPSPRASATSLIRRLTLDLTGLPPTLREVDEFLKDSSPDAYEKVVDRLLDSPHYGEHMTRFWLDAARYGDTHGMHLDNYREVWPYRDWVIFAFNSDKPLDRFIVEQLAGDLLPNATPDQLIATGFNRCHVSTNEAGSIDEEVHVRNVTDQVDTNGTVFMGLTIGCARCHDHKFDPIRARDYYQLFAFFNNIDGPALDGHSARWAPVVQVVSPMHEAALRSVDAEIAVLHRRIAAQAAKLKSASDIEAGSPRDEEPRRSDFVWIDDAMPMGADPGGGGPWSFVGKPEHPVQSGRLALRTWAQGADQRSCENAWRPIRVGAGDTLFVYIFIDKSNPPRELMLEWHTREGWNHRAYWGENLIDKGAEFTSERLKVGDLPAADRWARLEVSAAELKIHPGMLIDGCAFTQHGGTVYWDQAGIRTRVAQIGQVHDSFAMWVGAQRAGGGAGLPTDLKTIIALDHSRRTSAQTTELQTYFIGHASARAGGGLRPLRSGLERLERTRRQLDAEIPTTLVFRERDGPPRPAYLLTRGEYDRRGEAVGRAVPAFLPPLPAGAPLNRLGLAQWLIASDHPLTARVAVNRFWQQVFGTGLVKTAEDFGVQGEPPSHPELLNWLAVQFRDDGWAVKRFMKRLVMSAAYRQSSRVTHEMLGKDPDNRLLARGPRFRLDAETLRDQALFAGGLLVERVGGPSVKPPQPTGLWEAVSISYSNTARFTADREMEKTHCRSVYTFWKRTAPPPQMTTFDAPSREVCQVRRERTNTPLQALLMMNEAQFIEAAQALAERAMNEGGTTVEDRLVSMFRLVTSRPPDAKDLAELRSTLHDLMAYYKKVPGTARRLITTSVSGPVPRFDAVEQAAWTMIGNVILNLDEAITKG
jgi:hypothetical protein